MSIPKKSLNDMNKQVIQKIIAYQIKERKPIKAPFSQPFLQTEALPRSPDNLPCLTAKNIQKNLLDISERIKSPQGNKSLDSLPNYRIITNKLGKNYLQINGDKDVSSNTLLIESEVKTPAKLTPNKTTINFYQNEKHGLKIDIVLSPEKEISVILEASEAKNVKALKDKVLIEIKKHLNEKKFESILNFKTINKSYLIDYMLIRDTHSLSFLEQSEILRITPIYKESNNKKFIQEFYNYYSKFQ